MGGFWVAILITVAKILSTYFAGCKGSLAAKEQLLIVNGPVSSTAAFDASLETEFEVEDSRKVRIIGNGITGIESPS